MKRTSVRIIGFVMAMVLAATVLPANIFAAYTPSPASNLSSTKVTSITLSKTSITMNMGKTVLLTATVSPSNATNKAVTWSSSNAAVASPVLSTGFIMAKAIGTAVIICQAKDGSGVTAACNVKVVPAVPGSFVVARAGDTSVVVSWKAVIGATGYEVYRYSPLFSKYVLVKVTTSTSYLNTGLIKGKAYTYKVRAFTLVGLTSYYSDYTAEKTA